MNELKPGGSMGCNINPLKGLQKTTSCYSTVSDNTVKLDGSLLFVRPANSDSSIFWPQTDENHDKELFIDRPALLLSKRSVEVFFRGQWYVEKFSLSNLIILLAFINYQKELSKCNKQEKVRHCESGQSSVLLTSRDDFVAIVESEAETFTGLLISNTLQPEDRCLGELISFICAMENYWVACFFLAQVMDGDRETDTYKIYNAYKDYGVSESHFRKLCHSTFSCGPKKQLRMWRAAQSALQLIEKENSIAMIAGDNGYSSSSHFSSEIKKIFGITPKEFKKIGGFFHD